MAGITSYGAYIPLHRLVRSELHRAWGGMGMLGMSVPGEKAIASYDEDSITMGVEAAIDCQRDTDASEVDGLFLASTTHPYSEKQSSAIVSAALDLRRESKVADFAGSLRAGTIALGSAIDAINAGSAGRLLVAAADVYFRDTQHIVNLLMSAWYFMSPVRYTLLQVETVTRAPPWSARVYMPDAVTAFITGYRPMQIPGVTFPWTATSIAGLLIPLVLLWIAYVVFQRAQRYFSDVL